VVHLRIERRNRTWTHIARLRWRNGACRFAVALPRGVRRARLTATLRGNPHVRTAAAVRRVR
jgi:hypothetical protein